MDDQTIQAHLDELEQATVRPECMYYGAGTLSNNLAGRFADLRIRIKYLQFDAEATRRENAYLREMIEGQGRR